MSGRASANTIAGLRDGSAWSGDAKTQMAALDALVAREASLDDAAQVPDGIRAYVERNLSGMNPLEAAPDEALGDTDEAAAERCRRLFIGWAGEAGVDRVRWITKVDGNIEAGVAAYAAHEADDLHRLTALIRHKHRNEPDWDPGTPDEFAAGMLLRQVQDLSMGYRTRGMFGSSWKEFGRLSAAAQGKLEGLVMRMVAVSHARRSAQVAEFNRKFDDQTIPTTKEEADQLMADMVSEVIGRRVEPSKLEVTDDSSVTQSSAHSDDRNGDAAEATSGSPQQQREPTDGIDGATTRAAAAARDEDTEDDESPNQPVAQGVGPADLEGRTYAEVIARRESGLTGDFKHDGALITSVAQATGEHPQAKEIRRELGRMLAEMAPDDIKAKFDRITEGMRAGSSRGSPRRRRASLRAILQQPERCSRT